jgi:hypothetical protein
MNEFNKQQQKTITLSEFTHNILDTMRDNFELKECLPISKRAQLVQGEDPTLIHDRVSQDVAKLALHAYKIINEYFNQLYYVCKHILNSIIYTPLPINTILMLMLCIFMYLIYSMKATPLTEKQDNLQINKENNEIENAIYYATNQKLNEQIEIDTMYSVSNEIEQNENYIYNVICNKFTFAILILLISTIVFVSVRKCVIKLIKLTKLICKIIILFIIVYCCHTIRKITDTIIHNIALNIADDVQKVQNEIQLFTIRTEPHTIHTIPDSILDKKEKQLWKFDEYIRYNNDVIKISLMGDTGASICAMNKTYAKQKFPDKIKRLKRSIYARTASKTIALNEYIDLTFVNKNTKVPIITIEFYLIDNIQFKYLASLYLIRKLGWNFVKNTDPYTHKPECDEAFGTCNNWDQTNVKIKHNNNNTYNTKQAINKSVLSYYLLKKDIRTPYDEYLYICNNPTPIGTKLKTFDNIKIKNTTYNLPSNVVYNIGNFGATKDEIENAKKLTKDKPFPPINLEYLKKHTKYLYDKMKHLCHVEYKDVWAKHQFHRQTIPNVQFKIDLKEEFIDAKIYKPQYHLNDEKRLVLLHHTLKNIESGLFEPSNSTKYNVPIIIISRKDGRQRPAYDLTKLNACTKDVQSQIPTFHWLVSVLRQKGLKSIFDAKNYFENIEIQHKCRKYCTVTTPLGKYQLTHATYGFKNIATVAQEISDEFVNKLPCAGGAFIDDMFIRHKNHASDNELLNNAKAILQRARDTKILLHPEKTFFFVEEVEFLGYIFNQDGHRPTEKYVNKILKMEKPKTVKQIKSYLGLIQYIAMYLHNLAKWSYYLNVLTRKDTPI